MIQIDHRESRDVDIFLPDPQMLAYLDPRKRDFDFENTLRGYYGDGSGFVKFSFDVGEIDFIVGQSMTAEPTMTRLIEGVETRLETISEIIAKKIVYRGANIKPRDIFDIAAAAEDHSDSIVEGLRRYRKAVDMTLGRIERLNPDFVETAIGELMIRDRLRPMAATAMVRTANLLRSV